MNDRHSFTLIEAIIVMFIVVILSLMLINIDKKGEGPYITFDALSPEVTYKEGRALGTFELDGNEYVIYKTNWGSVEVEIIDESRFK